MESKKTTQRSRMEKSSKRLRGSPRTRGGAPTVKGRRRAQTTKRSNVPEPLHITRLSEVMALLQPKRTTSLSRRESGEDVIFVPDEKTTPTVAQNGNDCKELVLYSVSRDALRSMMGLGRRNRSDMHMTFTMFAGSPVTTASTAGSYFPLFTAFSSGNVLWATIIGAFTEFNSLDVLFDEFFVSKIVANFQPTDRYGANDAVAGLSNSRASVSFLPDNSGPYTNTSTTWIAMRSAIESANKHLADPWSFAMTNPTKMAWDGPIGDQTTAQSSMAWCNFSSSSTYGGIFQMAFPYATAATGTATTYTESYVLGTMLFQATVHVRARA